MSKDTMIRIYTLPLINMQATSHPNAIGEQDGSCFIQTIPTTSRIISTISIESIPLFVHFTFLFFYFFAIFAPKLTTIRNNEQKKYYSTCKFLQLLIS